MTRQQAKQITFRECLPERRALHPRFSIRAGPEGFGYYVRFCLLNHFYAINVQRSYCGAIALNRRFKRGENWLRGNDLVEGGLTTLPAILVDILNYELGRGRWRYRVQTVRISAPYTR